ncbi:MAG: IclR family transcriptional regulator [Chloroflexota bacterium]
MEKYAGTQALARAFRLIKLFDDDTPVWSLAGLTDASGLKRSTVFRLLAALEAEGLVRKTAVSEYTLGSELIVWGGRAVRANNLRTIAQPFLEQLVLTTTESVTIDVLWIDDEKRPLSIVIEEKLGRHVMGMAQYIGGRFPAHTTSTGKVLLAWQSDAVLQTLNLTILDKQTEFTRKDPKAFLQELETVRAKGFAVTKDELEIGLTAVSAPIFNHHGDIQAALCIGAPSSRIIPKLDKLAEEVMKTAVSISHALGYRKKNGD